MDFWRSEAYTKFFEYLELKGGFYYEVRTNMALLFDFFDQLILQRWGDAVRLR